MSISFDNCKEISCNFLVVTWFSNKLYQWNIISFLVVKLDYLVQDVQVVCDTIHT